METAQGLVAMDSRYLRVISDKHLDSARFALGLGIRIVFADPEAKRMLSPRVQEALLKIYVMQDIEATRQEVQRDPEFLAYLPDSLRNNPDVVRSAVEKDMASFGNAGHTLLNTAARFLTNNFDFKAVQGDNVYFATRDKTTQAEEVIDFLLKQVSAYNQAWNSNRRLSPKQYWRGVEKPEFLKSMFAIQESRGKTTTIVAKDDPDPASLEVFPNEIMFQILQHLSPFERAQLACTSQWFDFLVKSSFTDLVPTGVAADDAHTYWLKDFKSLFPS